MVTDYCLSHSISLKMHSLRHHPHPWSLLHLLCRAWAVISFRDFVNCPSVLFSSHLPHPLYSVWHPESSRDATLTDDSKQRRSQTGLTVGLLIRSEKLARGNTKPLQQSGTILLLSLLPENSHISSLMPFISTVLCAYSHKPDDYSFLFWKGKRVKNIRVFSFSKC